MYFYMEIIGEKFEVNKAQNVLHLASNAQNCADGGAYDAPPYPLVVRSFLPSAFAASRLRRSQFPPPTPLTHSSRSPQLLDRGCAPAILHLIQPQLLMLN